MNLRCYPTWLTLVLVLAARPLAADQPVPLTDKADIVFATVDQGRAVLTAKDEVLTYVARNLEPYRGFHSFMRASRSARRSGGRSILPAPRGCG